MTKKEHERLSTAREMEGDSTPGTGIAATSRRLRLADDSSGVPSHPKYPPRIGSMLSDGFFDRMKRSLADYYRPVFEAIRAQLSAQSERRNESRTVDEWIRAERVCVWHEVNHQRSKFRLEPVTLDAVERAERTAVGHSDYVSKYAHAAADLVFRKDVA